MSLYNLLFVFLAIYYIPMLKVEAVVGGKMVTPETFTYTVSVQIQREPNGRFKLLCVGAIISKNFIISVAHCYMYKNGTLKRGSFSIVAGAIDLNQANYIRMYVDKFYLPGFEKQYNFFNLAFLLLKGDLDLSNNKYLSTLTVAASFESFVGKTGVVGGFGYHSAEGTPTHNPKLINLQGTPSDHLKYVNVSIISDRECKKMYPDAVMINNMCGIVLPRRPSSASGICLGDGGSPLVIGRKLIGLASRTTKDCDNTKVGGLYTKVSSFAFFISEIMKGFIPSHAIILNNTIF